LSRAGIAEVRRATERLGVELSVVEAPQLEARAIALFPARGEGSAAPRRLAGRDMISAEMIAAGATAHSPSLLIYRSGQLAGSAILGYKTEETYLAMIEDRLGAGAPSLRPDPAVRLPSVEDTLEWSVEYPVPGRPGPYFRSVPGRQSLAFEAGNRVYLLYLTDGSTALAPGHVDFVPSPDGRLFVTPGRNPSGLEFYDAAEVFEGADRGAGGRIEPFYVDQEMRDQYPSVGILDGGAGEVGGRTVNRVLTSWFNRIVFRDYEVRREGARGRLTVTPLDTGVSACPEVSIPILSPDGRYVAGREESTASTKIFRIGERGECQTVADFGVQTGKVAWSPEGDRVAFAIPRGVIRDGRRPLGVGSDDPGLAGIFVYDRNSRELRRVPGSEDAHRLAFPEFVGQDSLAYLLTPEGRSEPSVFRLVCCVR
jgi:hypothetical protein